MRPGCAAPPLALVVVMGLAACSGSGSGGGGAVDQEAKAYCAALAKGQKAWEPFGFTDVSKMTDKNAELVGRMGELYAKTACPDQLTGNASLALMIKVANAVEASASPSR